MQNIVQMFTVELYVFQTLAVLQVFVFLTMCCMSIILSCVFPSDSHSELIEALLHTSVFKAVKFFFLSQVFHYIFEMIIVIKGFMANGFSVLHLKIIQRGHSAV